MMNEQEPVGQPEQTVEPVAVPAEQPQVEQNPGQGYWARFMRFLRECQRVLKVLQKPSREEFTTIAKVSALGITVIGLLGFILSMIQQLILQ